MQLHLGTGHRQMRRSRIADYSMAHVKFEKTLLAQTVLYINIAQVAGAGNQSGILEGLPQSKEPLG